MNAFCRTCGDAVCRDCYPGATLYAANRQLFEALTELVDIADASSYLTVMSDGDHDRVERARALLKQGVEQG
jgi:hypothetical protein